ncbi:hypothetical protein L3Q67_01760 [Saccharothrix sp. AJ9571]|nr:hypothetical protein L3Q67_01760 [Saccharothrix sp. AJ9571]
MVSTIHEKHRKRVAKVVQALQAQPPRVRSTLTELRRVFESSGEQPPAILAACATLLTTEQAITPDVLNAVRTASAEWDSFGELERELYSRCVYVTESRRAITASEPNEVTVLLREAPPRIADALNRLRWLNAATSGEHRDTYAACAALLKNPSADHPTVVHAIQTGYQLWPELDQGHRTLLTACIYASKERATHARARAERRAQQRQAQAAETRRCGNCDGNLSDTPELAYCSDACRREAEAARRPEPSDPAPAPAAPEAPARETAERRARTPYVNTEADEEYDQDYRRIIAAIPSAGTVRKDERAADAYEGERERHRDTDDTRDLDSELTGYALSDEDYERAALRHIAPGALCTACNLERTPTEQRSPSADHRCEICQERNAPPLRDAEPARELAAVA